MTASDVTENARNPVIPLENRKKYREARKSILVKDSFVTPAVKIACGPPAANNNPAIKLKSSLFRILFTRR